MMRGMPPKCERKFYIFQYPASEDMIRVGFGMQVAKTPTYPVMCPSPLSVALCDHNTPTSHTDRRSNIMLVA